MLSQEIIARIKNLSLRGRHLASDVMAGDYASAFHGKGMEFHEVREYVPGDDIRGIDWNVTARMNQPFVKIYREERELTLMLAVDVSASMSIGLGRSRRSAATELASVLAWLAIRSNDRVGLLLFGSRVELFIPPRKGQAHVWRIIKELLTWSNSSPKTDINCAVDHIAKTIKRRCACFIISDFLTAGGEESLGRLSRQHDVTCVLMAHLPAEGVFDRGGAGFVSFRDLETEGEIVIDTSDPELIAKVKESHEAWERNFQALIRKSGADLLRIKSEQSVVEPLMNYMRSHRPTIRRGQKHG